MRQRKHTLFTFSPYEYKGVEAYLNSQAARGWELENVNPLGVARFRRAQRADLRYCTDLLSYRRRREGRQAEREYLELCRGAGWELVDRWGSMGLFASLPGSDPVPIQTDPDTEWHNYRRAYRNSLFWAVMSLLPGVLLWVLIILMAGGLGAMGEALLPVFRFAWPRRWGVIAACASLPVLSAVGLWKLGDFLWNRLWGGRERTVHTPGRRALWANGVVNLLGVAALLVLLAGLVADLIQTGGSVGYFVGLAIGGAVAFLHPSFTFGEEVYPREFRKRRTYGGVCVLLGLLVAIATWSHGGDTARFWRGSPGFDGFYAQVTSLPVVRERDLGVSWAETYAMSRGVGPAGRYTLLTMDQEDLVSEPGELDGLSCSRYDCWSEWLAGQAADTLRRQTEVPEYQMLGDGSGVLRDYRFGEWQSLHLPWADEAWVGDWRNDSDLYGESRGQVLVVRAGSVAVRVMGPLELTGVDVLEAIRARLEL